MGEGVGPAAGAGAAGSAAGPVAGWLAGSLAGAGGASGRAAGTRTAAVAWGPFEAAELRATEPDHWIAAPEDLLRLVS